METSGEFHPEEIDLNLSLDSLDESDSLTHETQYQSELKDWISGQEHLIRQTSERSADEDMDGDRHDGAKPNDSLLGGDMENAAPSGSSRSEFYKTSLQDSSYSTLRYDPNWKTKQDPADRDLDHVSDGSFRSEDYSSPARTSPATTEKKERNSTHDGKRALSEHSAGLSRASGGTRNARDPSQKKGPQKDFVAKNRLTLGARKPKQHSYAHIHRKQAEETPPDTDPKKDLESGKKTSSDPPKEEALKTINKSIMVSATSESDGNAPRPQYSQNKTEFAASLPCNESPGAASGVKSTGGNINLRGDLLGFDLKLEERPLSFQRVSEDGSAHYYSNTIRWNDDFLRSAPNRDRLNSGESQDPYLFSKVGGHGLSEDRLIHQGRFLTEFPVGPFSSELQTNGLFWVEQDPEENSATGSDTISESHRQQRNRNHQVGKAQRKRSVNLLKQEVKLGGIGPSYNVSKVKEEQLRQQKEYAKAVHERNKNSIIPRVPENPVQSNASKKCPRQKGLEYAKNVPKPQILPKSTNQTKKEENLQLPVHPENLSPQLKLLQDLQMRHEREKAAVAALSALHII